VEEAGGRGTYLTVELSIERPGAVCNWNKSVERDRRLVAVEQSKTAEVLAKLGLNPNLRYKQQISIQK